MKRISALALMALMIIAMMSFAVSAKNNDKIEAPYFNIPPVIDGVVTLEEWGNVSVHVTPEQSASYYCDAGGGALDISFNMWLRWDETYLYIAVVTNEPDGHSLPQGEGSLWNGDVIQFRADPAGPNGSGDKNAPWSNASIPNISVGQLSDGKQTSWDFQASKEIPGAKYKINVGSNSTTYEVAIPHEYFGGKGKENFVYGFSLVRLNAPKGATYNAWLTWGDGICGPQENDDRVGSNSLTLVKKDAIIIPETTAATEAPAAAPAAKTPAAQTGDIGLAILAIPAIMSLASVHIVRKTKK